MRESRTYGSGRGACDETHVPTATAARVHHAARRRGGVAARGARAAGRACCRDWLAHTCSERVIRTANRTSRVRARASRGLGGRGRNVRSTTAGAEGRRADRAHAADLVALDAGRDRLVSGTSHGASAASEPRDDPDRLRGRCRSGGLGLVASLDRPGGNITGFTIFEFSIERQSGWNCSSEIVPGVTRVAVLRRIRRTMRPYRNNCGCRKRRAGARSSDSRRCNVRSTDEIERAIAAFARAAERRLIVYRPMHGDSSRTRRRAGGCTNRLPRSIRIVHCAADGGLMCYGPTCADLFRRAAALCRPHPQGREAGRPAGAGSRPNSNWSSTSRPPRRSASTCRRSLLARADEVIE